MKKLINYFILITFAFLLMACNGGGNSPSTTINVTMTDFQFTPATFTVPAGEQIQFSATNNGAVDHSFVIMKIGSEVTSAFSDKDQANVYWEKAAIPAGQTITDTFKAPADAGTYQIVCAVPGHVEAGMIAKLVVIAGG